MEYKTFEDWIEKLKKEAPDLEWETMDLTELKETFEQAKETDNGEV